MTNPENSEELSQRHTRGGMSGRTTYVRNSDGSEGTRPVREYQENHDWMGRNPWWKEANESGRNGRR